MCEVLKEFWEKYALDLNVRELVDDLAL